MTAPHLELQLHAGDILSRFNLRQPLDVGVQVPGGDLGVPAGHGLQQRVMNEDVLVLRLDHVVPLGAHQRDMAVDVDGLLVLDSLRHGVDHDEAACATHSSTETKKGKDGDVIFSYNLWHKGPFTRQTIYQGPLYVCPIFLHFYHLSYVKEYTRKIFAPSQDRLPIKHHENTENI